MYAVELCVYLLCHSKQTPLWCMFSRLTSYRFRSFCILLILPYVLNSYIGVIYPGVCHRRNCYRFELLSAPPTTACNVDAERQTDGAFVQRWVLAHRDAEAVRAVPSRPVLRIRTVVRCPRIFPQNCQTRVKSPLKELLEFHVCRKSLRQRRDKLP